MKRILVDAWRVIAPLPNDPYGLLSPLLLSLTFLTGLVDAFSYLALGHVFVATMTGNVIFVGFALAGVKEFSLPASTLALGAFLFGAFAGGRLITELGGHRGRLLGVASATEAVLVACAIILAALAARMGAALGTGPTGYGLIALLALAMGMQNAVARKLAAPDITTTVLTMTITGIAADARPAGGPGSRLGRRGLAALTLVLGAVVGGLLVKAGGASVVLVLAFIILGAVATTAAVASRANPLWARAA